MTPIPHHHTSNILHCCPYPHKILIVHDAVFKAEGMDLDQRCMPRLHVSDLICPLVCLLSLYAATSLFVATFLFAATSLYVATFLFGATSLLAATFLFAATPFICSNFRIHSNFFICSNFSMCRNFSIWSNFFICSNFFYSQQLLKL